MIRCLIWRTIQCKKYRKQRAFESIYKQAVVMDSGAALNGTKIKLESSNGDRKESVSEEGRPAQKISTSAANFDMLAGFADRWPVRQKCKMIKKNERLMSKAWWQTPLFARGWHSATISRWIWSDSRNKEARKVVTPELSRVGDNYGKFSRRGKADLFL